MTITLNDFLHVEATITEQKLLLKVIAKYYLKVRKHSSRDWA